MRRWRSTGEFRTREPMSDVPLLERAFARPVKSDAVARGNRRRASNRRLRCIAAMLAAGDYPLNLQVAF